MSTPDPRTDYNRPVTGERARALPLRCTLTGLTIPECSCPKCTARLVGYHAPEPVRGDARYHFAVQTAGGGLA
jgi:hypothetical protein